MLLSGLSVGLIGGAVYYLSTPTQVAAPAPLYAERAMPKPRLQSRTDRLQWMGEVPATATDRQEDPRPLANVINALIATRNPSDALKAYEIIEGCESRRTLFEHLSELNPVPPHLLAKKMQCDSITDVIRRSRYDYLSTAAYAGVPGAGSAWLRHGPSGDPEALRSRPNDPLVIEWKQQASALVIRDGDQGDFNALQDLMNGYGGKSPIFNADPSRELAYAMAYKDVVDLLQLGMPITNQPTDAELATLAANLTPEQVSWAKAKAAAIVAARRKRGN